MMNSQARVKYGYTCTLVASASESEGLLTKAQGWRRFFQPSAMLPHTEREARRIYPVSG